MNAVRFFGIFMVIACIICNCSSRIASGGEGNGSETIAKGFIIDESGEPVANAVVSLVPASYNPVANSMLPPQWQAVTDNYGMYQVTKVVIGDYNLESYDMNDGKTGLIQSIHVGDVKSEIDIDTLRLQVCGAIVVRFDSAALMPGDYVYIAGTNVFTSVDTQSARQGSVTLANVPSGSFSSIIYVAQAARTPIVLRDTVTVSPGSTAVTTYWPWKFSKRLVLNTTASGAGVAANVTDFPVLVRLTNNNFYFVEAKSGGEDVRFTKPDGTILPYEIERWDATSGTAEIWVRVDTVFGNDSLHFVTMRWGNPAATGASNGPAVFDTADGFQGVWHMGQAGGTTAFDATANHYDGTPFNMTAGSGVAGAVGNAQAFDGQADYLQMSGTAAGKLNFPANATYAISAWVFADTLDQYWHTIASKGDYQYNLEIIPSNEWQFAQFNNGAGWDMTASPGQAKTWTFLTGVRQGSTEYLYVNGVLADSLISLNPSTIQRYEGYDFMIGRNRNPASDTTGFFFNGIIDEVRVTSVAPSADWVKLCYMNQKAADQLVVYK
jgi:Concanavalin A-like lectin/glucanases superfamily/Domain of unknown function (DUF2341)